MLSRNVMQKYKPKIEALHKLECPNCSWNGKKIVFGGG